MVILIICGYPNSWNTTEFFTLGRHSPLLRFQYLTDPFSLEYVIDPEKTSKVSESDVENPRRYALLLQMRLIHVNKVVFPLPFVPVNICSPGLGISKDNCPMFFILSIRSVYKELHADHETGAADNK